MKKVLAFALALAGIIQWAHAQTCNGSLTVTIQGSSTNEVLDASGITTDLSCNSVSGTADGAIDLTATGGTPPYVYNWSDISGTDDAEDRTGLEAGSYTVSITDANNCLVEVSFTLTEPTAVSVVGTTTDLSCNASSGTADGAIDLTASGGTGTYTYAWTTTDGTGLAATAADQNGLSAGTYAVTVTDDNGCTAETSFTLTEPTAVSVVGTTTDLSCNASSGSADGAIDLTASGGTGTYTYAWTTTDGSGLAATAADQSGLSAGTYAVTVTDDNGCTAETSFTLAEPTAVVCTASSPVLGSGNTNILCAGGTGSIEVVASGGSGPYEYSLDGGSFVSSSSFTDISAGVHTITVRDANGCESTCSVELTEPAQLVAGSCNYIQDQCQLGDGQIQIEASGGIAPYSVGWSATPVAPNTVAGNLDQSSPQAIASSGGTVTFSGADGNNQYSFTVTDANGCELR